MSDAGIEAGAVVLLTGVAAGWLAGLVTHGSGFGPLGNILVALVGALAGLYAGAWIGLASAGNVIETMVATFLGAFGLLHLVARFRR